MIALLLFFLICLLVLYSWLSLLWDSKKNEVPGPTPLPIVGNGHLFLGDSAYFLKRMQRICEEFGGIARFYVMSTRIFLLSEPKYIEALLTNNDLLVKGRSYYFLLPWLGQGLLTTSFRWKVHRRLLTPAFHFNILQNFFQIFVKNDKILIKNLRATGKGTNISLFPVIALNALDNVTESIMGVSVNAQNNAESEYIKALEKMNDVLATRIRDVFAAQDALFNLMSIKKIHDRALQVLHKSSRDVIAARRKELEKNNITQLTIENDHGIKNRNAFLDLLLLAEVDGQRIDDEHIREEVDTFMFEGHDTTTSGIVFTLYCLSKYRDAQEKVFEEQKEIFGGDFNRDPTFSEIQKMKYLDLVIKESMRMYSPVPVIERFITEDTELAGVRIPKNTTCIVNIFNLHRNPKVWDKPMEFRPERFENPLKDPFTFVAFSAGSRNCIGQKFAMLEMKTTISAIVRNFKILPSDLPEPNVGMVIVLRSQNGVHIKLEER
ncbi:cytochrome p450 domain-containing protein [Phthorimaea operculella]|nr:cytochrome p450 domain-containing protein [Phthorimaea operculella]